MMSGGWAGHHGRCIFWSFCQQGRWHHLSSSLRLPTAYIVQQETSSTKVKMTSNWKKLLHWWSNVVIDLYGHVNLCPSSPFSVGMKHGICPHSVRPTHHWLTVKPRHKKKLICHIHSKTNLDKEGTATRFSGFHLSAFQPAVMKPLLSDSHLQDSSFFLRWQKD